MALSRVGRITASLVAGLAAARATRTITRVRRYAIAEGSMEPALHEGDYVITARLDEPHLLGDIVVYEHPQRPGFELVKRVVGRPGDLVEIRGGRTYLNGDALPEPWATPPISGEGRWRLGRDEIFVLGDRRDRSADDSRSLGPIPVYNARWVVRFRYWPPRRIGWL